MTQMHVRQHQQCQQLCPFLDTFHDRGHCYNVITKAVLTYICLLLNEPVYVCPP